MSNPNRHPTTRHQLDQIAADVTVGRLPPDPRIEEAITVNIAWAARFLSRDRRQQLESLLWVLTDTDPTLLDLSGRACPL